MNKSIYDVTEYLFHCDYFDDSFDPEGNENHLDIANELLANHSWQEIFPVWKDYLHNHCKTADDVINFTNLFIYYGGTDEFVPEPYDFVGYIFYMVDIDRYWDKAGDTLDSLANAVLQKSGYVDLIKNPYYQAWKDPKVIAVVNHYKQT